MSRPRALPGWQLYSALACPPGGRVVTTYDQNKNGVDQSVLASDGQLVSHSIRKYDKDEQLKEKPEGQTVPQGTVVQYSYQYDQCGNGTERVASVANQPARVTRRTLTYY